MTDLILAPTRYGMKNDAMQLRIDDIVLNLQYSVEERMKYKFFQTDSLATITADIAEEVQVIRSYAVPRDGRIKNEIETVENTLYSFIDESFRSVVQLKKAQATKDKAETLYDLCFNLDAKEVREYFLAVHDVSDEQKQAVYQQFDNLANDLVTTVSHLTNITSLTREGLENYQEKRGQSLALVLAGKGDLPQTLLESVVHYLDFERTPQDEKTSLQLKLIDYLSSVAQTKQYGELSVAKATQLLTEFVPWYLTNFKDSYKNKAVLPKDHIEHIVRNFFLGGVLGLVIIGIPELVFNHIFQTHLSLPTWYIGAGYGISKPYVQYAYQQVKPLIKALKSENKDYLLIQSFERRLLLPSSNAGSTDLTIDSFLRDEREKLNNKLKKRRVKTDIQLNVDTNILNIKHRTKTFHDD